MKNLTLKQIAAVCGGKLLYCDDVRGDKEVSGVELDSRRLKENDLFIATKGERVDGHDFIAQAMSWKAAAAVCEKTPDIPTGPCIVVEDSFQALKDIAAYYRSQLSVKVVGITGSVGKTSTKEFIASVLSQKFCVLKTEGNFNNEVGLPLTILKIRREHEVAVLEMGISDFGEMHRLSRMARPDICVMTNIGQCHLETLKSREGILRAKTEMFDFMAEDGVVCLNGDDDMLHNIKAVKGRETLSYGLMTTNHFYADQLESLGLLGSRAVIHAEGESLPVQIPLPGEHMIYNALAAACVGRLLELNGEEICGGINKTPAVNGRSHIIRAGKGIIIDDCYNANPASVCAALDMLSTADGKKAAVLGDMFELGGEEEKLHWKVGAYAVQRGINTLICIGKLSLRMYEGAVNAARKSREDQIQIYYYPNKEEFLQVKEQVLTKSDTVLIKASHGMEFTSMINCLVKYFEGQC